MSLLSVLSIYTKTFFVVLARKHDSQITPDIKKYCKQNMLGAWNKKLYLTVIVNILVQIVLPSGPFKSIFCHQKYYKTKNSALALDTSGNDGYRQMKIQRGFLTWIQVTNFHINICVNISLISKRFFARSEILFNGHINKNIKKYLKIMKEILIMNYFVLFWSTPLKYILL
jgi:hypothetical protein